MKIFDCFMYFDEDLVLDLRLNYLSKFVDNFVIVESKFNHKGEERKPPRRGRNSAGRNGGHAMRLLWNEHRLHRALLFPGQIQVYSS